MIMDNKFENIIYFGVVFDKFEVLDFTTDFLAGVRTNYFNSGLKTQKDKALQHLEKSAYFFSYNFEKGVPADWILKVNAKLAQESEIIDDESYCIKAFSKNDFVYKKIYFDNNHKWIKTEYFNDESGMPAYCLKNAIAKGQNVIKKISYKNDTESVSYLFPKLTVPEDGDYSVLAYTNKGFVYFNSVPNKGFEFLESDKASDFGFSFKIEDFDDNTSEFDIRNAEYLEYNSDEENIIEPVTEEQETTSIFPEVSEDVIEVENTEEIITIAEFDETPDTVINSGGEEYRYYGETQNGKRHGYGRTVTATGKTAYEGSYFDDKRNGFGSFYCKNGDINYLGNWENNNRQGFGVGFRNTDFTAHIGKWNENTPDGIGARFNRNGDFLFLGEFSNGKKQGIGISFDENAGFIISKFDDDKVVSSHLLKDIFPDAE